MFNAIRTHSTIITIITAGLTNNKTHNAKRLPDCVVRGQQHHMGFQHLAWVPGSMFQGERCRTREKSFRNRCGAVKKVSIIRHPVQPERGVPTFQFRSRVPLHQGSATSLFKGAGRLAVKLSCQRWTFGLPRTRKWLTQSLAGRQSLPPSLTRGQRTVEKLDYAAYGKACLRRARTAGKLAASTAHRNPAPQGGWSLSLHTEN